MRFETYRETPPEVTERVPGFPIMPPIPQRWAVDLAFEQQYAQQLIDLQTAYESGGQKLSSGTTGRRKEPLIQREISQAERDWWAGFVDTAIAANLAEKTVIIRENGREYRYITARPNLAMSEFYDPMKTIGLVRLGGNIRAEIDKPKEVTRRGKTAQYEGGTAFRWTAESSTAAEIGDLLADSVYIHREGFRYFRDWLETQSISGPADHATRIALAAQFQEWKKSMYTAPLEDISEKGVSMDYIGGLIDRTGYVTLYSPHHSPNYFVEVDIIISHREVAAQVAHVFGVRPLATDDPDVFEVALKGDSIEKVLPYVWFHRPRIQAALDEARVGSSPTSEVA